MPKFERGDEVVNAAGRVRIITAVGERAYLYKNQDSTAESAVEHDYADSNWKKKPREPKNGDWWKDTTLSSGERLFKVRQADQSYVIARRFGTLAEDPHPLVVFPREEWDRNFTLDGPGRTEG